MAEFQEISQTDQHAHRDGQEGSPGCAQSSHAQPSHENVVQDYVQDQSGEGHHHPDVGFAVGAHQVLEEQLEGHRHRAQENHEGVWHHVLHQPRAASQKNTDRFQEQDARRGKCNREY